MPTNKRPAPMILERHGTYISVPSGFAAPSGGVVVTCGLLESLLVMLPERFEQAQRRLSTMPHDNPAVTTLKRLLIGFAHLETVDSQGRLEIAAPLASYSRITSEVAWVTMGTHAELWAPTNVDPTKSGWPEEI